MASTGHGIHGALGLAKRAVDAFFRIDYQVVGARVEAVHGAHFDTIGVLAFDAAFENDKGH
jgi:hypothetical protein